MPAGMGGAGMAGVTQGFTGHLEFAYLVGLFLSVDPGRCIVVAENSDIEELGNLNPCCTKTHLTEEQFSVSLTNTFLVSLVVFFSLFVFIQEENNAEYVSPC